MATQTSFEDRIIKELEDLKSLFAKLIGTSSQPETLRFSNEALDKAAKDYLAMTIQRGEWITEDELPKYLRQSAHRAGALIQEAFAFTRIIKKGHSYLYYKEDVIALGDELKARNIDLSRYREYRDDKANFEKKVAAILDPSKSRTKGKRFKIPTGLKNITTSEIPKPDPTIVRQDLANLKAEFKKAKYHEYIDIYRSTHAMLKTMYYFEKYLEPGLKARCRKWCESFNYANNALQLITGRPEKFSGSERATIEL